MGRKGPVSLDSLSKEELTAKCKQLLQLAQKAKQAKDGNEYNFFGVGSIIKKTLSQWQLSKGIFPLALVAIWEKLWEGKLLF